MSTSMIKKAFFLYGTFAVNIIYVSSITCYSECGIKAEYAHHGNICRPKEYHKRYPCLSSCLSE